MIDELRKNVETEIQILREISTYSNRMVFAKKSEKKLLFGAIKSLQDSMKIVNNSIPKILASIYPEKSLREQKVEMGKELESFSYQGIDSELHATINRKDRETLLKSLSISESNIRKIRRKDKNLKEDFAEFKAARGYLKFSNKYFLTTAMNFIRQGYFKKLAISLKKANIDILFQTYVAMIFMSVFLSIFAGILIWILAIFFNLKFIFPFISLFEGSHLIRMLKLIWIPFVFPAGVFFVLYFYPSTEKSSIAKRIEQELPFAVVHMSAISGSGIQPSEIFRIIGLSREYPYLRKEVRKILNQINIYGYDIVTALNNVSRSTPSSKLAELFTGLATTIHSGGGLSQFFEKRAETLLLNYRIERQKYAKTAETFMDIYISVVIAAPMILMLMLVIMSLANFNIGLTTGQITFLIIAVLVLLNTIFLTFLHIGQPNY